MFAPHDTVVYKHHVCTIKGIREKHFEGKDYFELKALFDKSLKLFVAVEDAVEPAMRFVMSKDEALALIDSIVDAETIDESRIVSPSDTTTVAERRVREEYDRRLKTFQPHDLIPILKSIHERTERRQNDGRRIVATDKKYFDLAEGLLCDELSVSLGIDRDSVHDFLVQRIKRAEEKKAKRR